MAGNGGVQHIGTGGYGDVSEVMLGEDDVLETKGRWRKMNKQLDKSHNHGLITDALAYSAYDTQSGTTMVWNEVRFRSTRTDPKQRRERQGSIDALNHRLAQLKKIKHRNILKIRDFWLDTANRDEGRGGRDRDCSGDGNMTRLVYITEQLSSGTLRSYISENRRAIKARKDPGGPRSSVQDKILRRWSTQILSALHYLHTCRPPIKPSVSSDSILIDHLGVIKIDAMNESDIEKHVKTRNREAGTMGWEYIPPELVEVNSTVSQQQAEESQWRADIYAFGIICVEMATLEKPFSEMKAAELVTKGEARPMPKALDSVQDPEVKEFICHCLAPADERWSAKQLLFHSMLRKYPEPFPSLKRQAAVALVGPYDRPKGSKRESDFERVLASLERETEARCMSVACLPRGTWPCDPSTVSWRNQRENTFTELEKYIDDLRHRSQPLYMIKGRLQSGITLEQATAPTNALRSTETRRVVGDISVKVTKPPPAEESTEQQQKDAGPLFFSVRFSLTSAEAGVTDVSNTLVRHLKFDLPRNTSDFGATASTLMVEHDLLHDDDRAAMKKKINDSTGGIAPSTQPVPPPSSLSTPTPAHTVAQPPSH